MAQVEIIMPKMGESIVEATILTWLKKPGDTIELEESMVEVATDKVDTEIPSTHAGILKEILVQDGAVVKVGDPIAILEAEVDAADDGLPAPEPARKSKSGDLKVTHDRPPQASHTNGLEHAVQDFKASSKFFSPLVKNIAKQENISVAELETIQGSGAEGRITKSDVLDFVQHRKQNKTTPAPSLDSKPAEAPAPTPLAAPSFQAGDEIIEMDRMRKMIAERMVDSKRIAPHVTSFVEADVTNVVAWRNKVKHEFQKREGDALTFTPVFVEAIAAAIRDYPMINIQVEGSRIIRKKDINIGIAVALPSGNLIVPVIRNADQLSIGSG